MTAPNHHYLDSHYFDGELFDAWAEPVVAAVYSGVMMYVGIGQRERELDIRQRARGIDLSQGQRELNLIARTR